MKKLMHVVMGVIIGTIISTGIVYAADELIINPNPFPVYINGVETPVEAYNINGFTYLKLADMKKAGIEVKFNETERRIEILSAQRIQATTPSSITTEGGIDMGKPEVPLNKYGLPDFEKYKGPRPEIEDDGINQYITFEGVKYIGLGGRDKNRPPIVTKPVYLSVRSGLALWKKIQVDGTYKGVIVLNDIPHFRYRGMYFIPYDYYLNTFLPAIQGD